MVRSLCGQRGLGGVPKWTGSNRFMCDHDMGPPCGQTDRQTPLKTLPSSLRWRAVTTKTAVGDRSRNGAGREAKKYEFFIWSYFTGPVGWITVLYSTLKWNSFPRFWTIESKIVCGSNYIWTIWIQPDTTTTVFWVWMSMQILVCGWSNALELH